MVREEIRIIPAQVERVQMVRECYICPGCKVDDVTGIKKAVVPHPLLKHSLASPSIVAHIMFQKYVNALPLNRQKKDFARLGVRLDWFVQPQYYAADGLVELLKVVKNTKKRYNPDIQIMRLYCGSIELGSSCL